MSRDHAVVAAKRTESFASTPKQKIGTTCRKTSATEFPLDTMTDRYVCCVRSFKKESVMANGNLIHRISLATLALLLLSCSPQQAKPDGRNEVEEIIRKQSNGLIQVIAYEKTNGIEITAPVHAYEVEFVVAVEFLDDVYWSGEVGLTGWLGQFCAIKRNATQRVLGRTMPTTAPPGYIVARKGDQLRRRNRLTYLMTEQGWRGQYRSC